MDQVDSPFPLVLHGSDYPTELIASAAILASKAAQSRKDHPPDERNIPLLEERALARAAVFTACNCLESLLMDCIQAEIAAANPRTPLHQEIEEKIKKRQANISWTIKELPDIFRSVKVHKSTFFAHFEDIFALRNELVHPKVDTYGAIGARSQDQLLKMMDAQRARWVVEEVAKMAKELYAAFGVKADLSFSDPFAGS